MSRGDIVVAHNPDASNTGVSSIVKRVIGLPGETVTIDDDHVIIDGHVLIEPYLEEGMPTLAVGPHPCVPSDPCVIPDGQVWLMGDNRTDSKDSRYFGPVPQSDIVGRADFRLLAPQPNRFALGAAPARAAGISCGALLGGELVVPEAGSGLLPDVVGDRIEQLTARGTVGCRGSRGGSGSGRCSRTGRRGWSRRRGRSRPGRR